MSRSVAVIGAGAVGTGIAWHLSRNGDDITLFDPSLKQSVDRHSSEGLSGTSASLGVLTGHVFRRSSGRAWRLRQRSMELWPGWVRQLQEHEPELQLKTPLLQLAENDLAFERMIELAGRRTELGLQIIPRECLQTIWPGASHGGLQSRLDGRLDPITLQRALRKALDQLPVQQIRKAVCSIDSGGDLWTVTDTDGQIHSFQAVVVCAALASSGLLKPLTKSVPMQPVLGQALALNLREGPLEWNDWPAVLMVQGFNLIPNGPGQLLLGATVEPGDAAAKDPLALMQTLNGNAPEWLRSATVIEHWHGLRARPLDRPAPVLEMLQPGLVVATGHYRNGILLTPVTAEWVSEILDHNLPITGI